MMNFSVILEPQKVEYSTLVEDISSSLWKLNVSNLKKLYTIELIRLYYAAYSSSNFKRMLVQTLSLRRRNVDGKKI